MIFTNKSLSPAEVVRTLGFRYREYRTGLNMSRKQVAELTSLGMTTLYKFETGRMTDISFGTLLRLLKAIGLHDNWEQLLPELPESPYLYHDNNRKKQRIRHTTSEQ